MSHGSFIVKKRLKIYEAKGFKLIKSTLKSRVLKLTLKEHNFNDMPRYDLFL